MSDENSIYVHPSITWQQFDDEHLQIRVPDGQHITLTESVDAVNLMLNHLSTPQSYDDIVKWAEKAQIGKEELDSTLTTLHEYSIIIESNKNEDLGLFGNVIDFNINSSTSIRSGLPFPYFTHFDVIGDKNIKACVTSATATLEQQLAAKNTKGTTSPLRIVCSDTGDQQYILAENSKAINDKVAMLPVQWTDEFLSIGPLYIPEESSCYQCLNIRRRAASNFLPELDGVLNKAVQRSTNPQFDTYLNHLITYAVGRYLSIVSHGMFHLIKPNEMESWDVIKGEKTVGEVLKVPRCDACGRKKASDPIRAIRDLNS